MMADAWTKGVICYEESPVAKIVFSTTRFAWLWTIICVWLGWQWIDASLHKIGSQRGQARSSR